jgi:hypothetical protein
LNEHSDASKISNPCWLVACLAIPVAAAYFTLSLSASWDGDSIHVTAPDLHFLAGKPLERLKDGATVTFLSQLSISTDSNRTIFRRLPERFVVSYDVWEEKLKVTRLGGLPRSASHLSVAGAEAWCLQSMAISAAGIPPDRPIWLRFDLRVADPREEAAVVGEPGINITRMIELFSRRPRPEQPQWVVGAGPIRLLDIRRVERRGTRTG